MSEALPEPTPEESLQQARDRLGGQWAIYLESTQGEEAPTMTPAIEVIGQRRIAELNRQAVQKQIELGMLAMGSNRKAHYYFAQ